MRRLVAPVLLLACLPWWAGCDDGGDDGGTPRPQSGTTATVVIDPNQDSGHTVDAHGAAAEAAYLAALAHQLPDLRKPRLTLLGYGYTACSLREEGLPGESYRGSLIRAGLTSEQEAVVSDTAQIKLCPHAAADHE